MVGVGETSFLQYLMFANSKCYLFVKTKTYFFIIIGCFESHLRTPTFTPFLLTRLASYTVEKLKNSLIDSSISRLFGGSSSKDQVLIQYKHHCTVPHFPSDNFK